MPEFDPNARLDTSQIEDRRGSGGGGMFGGGGPGRMGGGGIPGGGKTVGGGIVGIIIAVAIALLGGGVIDTGGSSSPYGRLNDQSFDGQANNQSIAQRCQSGTDAQTKEDCQLVAYVNNVQSYWQQEFRRRGAQYPPAPTVFFSGATQTGCGNATSAVGPFYCPADQKVYIDLGFLDEMRSRFGVKGQFAPAYVLAHEYGHHIQNQIGTLDAAQRDREGPQSGAVRVELQADCLAGVWANHAATAGILTSISEQDINEALNAASAVGDDRIQKQTQGRVNPESWTHGSSEQRRAWFGRGYQSGNMDTCDTFRGTV